MSRLAKSPVSHRPECGGRVIRVHASHNSRAAGIASIRNAPEPMAGSQILRARMSSGDGDGPRRSRIGFRARSTMSLVSGRGCNATPCGAVLGWAGRRVSQQGPGQV